MLGNEPVKVISVHKKIEDAYQVVIDKSRALNIEVCLSSDFDELTLKEQYQECRDTTLNLGHYLLESFVESDSD